MSYSNISTLTEKLGNNAFAWDRRYEKYRKSPTLTIPSLINGSIADVQIGDEIVFEEMADEKLISCVWLRNFVKLKRWKSVPMGAWGEDTVWTMMKNSEMISRASTEWVCLPTNSFGTFWTKSTEENWICIFDNHNHALYFWIDAVRRWVIEKGFELIHIDEHSDLWDNEHDLDLERAISDEAYSWDFTNLSCNVGNYIQPALRAGLVGNMIRIENEYQIDAYMDYVPRKNTVLNIDLDIFAPELDHIDEWKKVKLIQNLLKKCTFVTIATSPYFIDQWVAIEKLNELF